MTADSPRRNAPVWVTAVLVVVAVVLVVVAIVYFVEPAQSLPSFFPGRTAGLARHHTTHGIAALIVGALAAAGAWMSGGTRRSGRTTASSS